MRRAQLLLTLVGAAVLPCATSAHVGDLPTIAYPVTPACLVEVADQQFVIDWLDNNDCTEATTIDWYYSAARPPTFRPWEVSPTLVGERRAETARGKTAATKRKKPRNLIAVTRRLKYQYAGGPNDDGSTFRLSMRPKDPRRKSSKKEPRSLEKARNFQSFLLSILDRFVQKSKTLMFTK